MVEEDSIIGRFICHCVVRLDVHRSDFADVEASKRIHVVGIQPASSSWPFGANALSCESRHLLE